MKKKSRWSNKKHGSKIFTGSYEIKKNGQRVFNLTCVWMEISFESYNQAKKLGWVKL